MARQYDPKAAKRNLLIRQTVIYSITIAALVVVGIAAWGMFNGKMKPWFDDGFAAKPTPTVDTGPQPCPADDSTYPKLSDIVVDVQNGSDKAGAAARAALALNSLGIETSTRNTQAFAGTIKVVVGVNGVDRGYAILKLLPRGSRLAMDNREDDSVWVVLGEGAQPLGDLTQVKYEEGTVIPRPPGCTAPEEIAAELPKPKSPSPTAEPEETQPAEG
jgi:hypothetical protein